MVARCVYYQTTPVGARSKLVARERCKNNLITRPPLWGRDQNDLGLENEDASALPDHPCGGEIKTLRQKRRSSLRNYQTTPVGARSKQEPRSTAQSRCITRPPLWGRDQNCLASPMFFPKSLPDHPCGGEIKTQRLPRWHRRIHYQTTPVGARSKHPTSTLTHWRNDYQTTPVGARSKRSGRKADTRDRITRPPLWGRDQNVCDADQLKREGLPDHPCGGEIKTCFR